MKKWETGNIVEIKLTDGFSYGAIVNEPLVVFFNALFDKRPKLEEILEKPVAFKIWIMNRAIGKNGWPIVGNLKLPAELMIEPRFYKYDQIAKSFSVYSESRDIPATKEECLDLECAAAWSLEHVESRLADQYSGKTNMWVESLHASNRAT